MTKLLEQRRHVDWKEELKAHLAARQELGPEMDDLNIASFLDKLERELDARIEARFAQETRLARRERRGATATLVITLAMAIPLTAVAASYAGLAGMGIVWAALLLLNFYRR